MKKSEVKKETKKEIHDELYLYTEIDTVICGSLQQTAENILSLEKRLKTEHQLVVQNPGKYIRFNIRIGTPGYDYDESPEIKLYGVRMETDEEFEKRIEKNKKSIANKKWIDKKRKENNKKRELATFLRLKNKFENK